MPGRSAAHTEGVSPAASTGAKQRQRAATNERVACHSQTDQRVDEQDNLAPGNRTDQLRADRARLLVRGWHGRGPDGTARAGRGLAHAAPDVHVGRRQHGGGDRQRPRNVSGYPRNHGRNGRGPARAGAIPELCRERPGDGTRSAHRVVKRPADGHREQLPARRARLLRARPDLARQRQRHLRRVEQLRQ